MKVNSLAKKTAIAAAIAFASGSVFAGDLTIATPSVFANEIFGDRSENTTVRMPAVVFTADSNVAESVDGVTSAANDTIKLSLEGDAVFGENYQDPSIWAQQGIQVLVGATALTADDVQDVTGGTATDNQITITLARAVGSETLSSITLEGFKVKNLKDTLARGEKGTHSVTVEVDAVDAGKSENTPEVVAFYSVDGVVVDAKATTYSDAGGRAWLQAGDDYKTFTLPAGGNAEKNNLDSRNVVLNLGEFIFERGQLDLGGGNVFNAGKETGVAFDFTGADDIHYTLSTDGPALNAYPNLRLTTAANCAAATPANSIVFDGAESAQTVTRKALNVTLGSSSNMRLCVVAPVDADGNGTGPSMPEATFTLAAKVEYFNTRYTDSEGEANFGRVERNVAGCQISLFNLPNPNAQDNAFIRFTNTSSGGAGMTGPVIATVWGQNGELLDENVEVFDSLAPHATVVLHTDATNGGGVNLAEKLPGFADSNGRSRIILEGEFTNCEALGMIRSPEGGLTNMTSTVYSGSQNGTSNTRN